MEQVLSRSSHQLMRSLLRSQLTREFPVRHLTQADLPPKSDSSNKSSIGTEPGLGQKTATDSTSSVKTPDSALPTADARMTSAGILLPKDSAAKLDANDKKKSNKNSYKSQVSGSEETGKEEEKRQFSSSGGGTMKAWQISRFGDIAALKLVEDSKVPALTDPFDLLVEIHAASVNPFDVARTRGYGENLIDKMRDAAKLFGVPHLPDVSKIFSRKEKIFPVILGRDFSGVVVEKGRNVSEKIQIGDEVFGVIGPHRQGSFAQYSATSNFCLAKKPKNISHSQAASLPYVACTAWSAMKLVANLPNLGETTRVLVLGGSGGVGSFAIQYLKTLGVHVTTVCGTDGLDLVAELGADDVIDYKTGSVEGELEQREKYDVIFQASGNDYGYLKKFLKGNLKSFFVTLNYPLLKNSDDLGSFSGLLKSGMDFSAEYFRGLTKGSHTIWAFFTPNGSFLEEVAFLVEKNKIRPVVGKTFPFKDLPSAFQQVDSGETNGKVVVEMKKD